MSKTYSNVRMSNSVLANTVPGRLPHPPYTSRGGFSLLTEKEKLARKVQASYGAIGTIGVNNLSGANTVQAQSQSFFSPQLSTDFLELPQSLRERREIYRHYYHSDPIVGQAIDLHTELPMSKVRLSKPKPSTCPEGFKSPEHYAKYILNFFERMCAKNKLFQRLITASRHYWLDGNVFLFAEDSTVEVPEDVGYRFETKKKAVLNEDGSANEYEVDELEEHPDKEDRELAYYQKHYQGWSRLIILPIDQVKLETYSFTDSIKVDLIPSDRDRALIERAKSGDEDAQKVVASMPAEVRDYIESGKLIPLGTDPDEGSFVYHLAARRNAGEELGSSILDRVLRVLNFREKLRQAQTQIASRAMTPKRVVWAEGLSDVDTDDLREQVDLAMVDPDYTIVSNYEVHWDEIGAKDRLLDLQSEYEITDKQLYAGLGVTESLLNGESTFSGDRVKLEVINTRYMLFREILQEYVEENLFKPVARRKGFVEIDEFGDEVVIYPKLSFTRLALRDSQDTYDALFNLYQKGSVSIDLILEMFNIDPSDTREKIEKDMGTVNDSTFNEVVRGMYSEAARTLAEKTDIVERLAKYMKLEMKAEPAPEEEGRF
jgi:hypothetical protein